jgi:LacI family transcriptional regulator
MKDVADAAGVSTATVSHVINKTRFVNEDIKQKVYVAIERLDYHPNSIARSLRSRQTRIVGVIIPNIRSLFYGQMTDGIEETLRENGYQIILANSHDNIDKEQEIIRTYKSLRVDGILMCPAVGPHEYLFSAIPTSMPIAFVDRYPLDYPGDRIVIDLKKSTFSAIDFLLSKGHKRIGMITGYSGISATQERYEGYIAAYEHNGLPYDATLVRPGEYTSDAGYDSTKYLIDNANISALFFADAPMSIGSIMYLEENNIKVPDDISMISSNDYEWTKINVPPLTIVKKPSYELGVKAATLILDKIEDDQSDREYYDYRLQTTLIHRASVK